MKKRKMLTIHSPKTSGTGRVAMVLSRNNKRGRVPDDSTAAERAEWIGQPVEVNGQPAIVIDAIYSHNCWFLQYAEVPGVQQ